MADSTKRAWEIVRAVPALAAVAILLSLLRGEGILPPAAQRHPFLALGFLALAVLLATLPAAASFRATAARVLFASHPVRFRVAVAALGVIGYAVAAAVTFHAVPRLDDGISSLYQARIFLSGRLVLPPPEHPEFFRLACTLGPHVGVPHLCTMYPPAWPLLLMPGVLLGAPWLVNPLLGGLLVLAVVALATELFDERAGRAAGLLAACSPFVTELAGSHLSHIATALLLTVCFRSALRLVRTGRTQHGLAAGAAWSGAFLCRPLTALVIGAVIGFGLLLHGRRLLSAWRGVAVAMLLAAAGAGCLAAWQYRTTGHARTPGHEVGMGRRGRYGFVKLDRARTHTPRLGVLYTLGRMRAANDKLIGWPVPALAIVLLPLMRRRPDPVSWWLMAPWLGLLAAFAPFWYWEEYYPGRYTFCAMPMLLVLAGRACAGPQAGPVAAASVRPWPTAAVVVGCLYALLVGRPHHLRRFTDHHGDVESLLAPTLRAFGVTRGLVFMNATGVDAGPGDTRNDFYGTGFLLNRLDLQGDLVFARDLGDRNRLLAEAYPDRPYYRYVYVRGRNAAELYAVQPTPGGLREEPLGSLDSRRRVTRPATAEGASWLPAAP